MQSQRDDEPHAAACGSRSVAGAQNLRNMKGFSPISRAYRRLVRKHRLTLQNEVDNAEEWHMHISVVRIFAALLAFVLLLFILILSLVAYTPVLEFLPGYEANRSREMLLQNIMRLDSIERQMTQMRTYSDNIALIMEGKTPVVRNVGGLDSIKADKTLVMPSCEDSLLRIQMEGEGPYGLGKSPSRKTLREAMAMTAPVEGIITEKFDTKLGQYGIRIAAAPGSQVSAVDNGTVVLSLWSPEEGYVVQVQHADNVLSIYKNLAQSMVSTGQRLRSGEVLGYSNDPQAEGTDSKLFGFELWSDGKPVDPEGYIVF